MTPRTIARAFNLIGGLAVALPLLAYAALSILSALADLSPDAARLLYQLGLQF